MRPSPAGGFTIVELLIVIIIIAILAAIVTVAYNGIQTRAAQAIVKDALSNASTAMKTAAAEGNLYNAIPVNVKVASNVGLALTELTAPATNATAFCMNGVHSKYANVRYHITESGSIEEGLCSGTVIAETIIGSYLTGSEEETLGYVPITAKTVSGDKYGFTVTANSDWTQVALSWNAQPGAIKYEVQTRNITSGGAWAYRLPSTGGATANSCGSSSCTIPAATTSLTWTDTTSAVPSNAGRTYEYQLRACTTTGSTDCTDWSIASLANPIQDGSPLPKVSNFTATPASDWSNVALAWNASPRFAALMADQKYEVQSRRTSAESWSYRLSTTGGTTANSCSSSSCTIPTTTTSLTWTNTGYAIPYAPGQTYDYRIRACVTGVAVYCGDWKEISLANPIQDGSLVPDVANFSVTAAGDWSSISLTWSAASSYAAIQSSTKYELQSRRSSSDNWAYRATTTGASTGASCASTSCTISPATTSLTWTNTSFAIPPAGQTYEYRIRNCADSSTTYCGNWSTRTLSR